MTIIGANLHKKIKMEDFFPRAFAEVLDIEKGYQDLFNDKGNWTGGQVGKGTLIGTKYGISAPVLCGYLKRVATKADMMNLTKETAAQIYRVEFWNKKRLNEIRVYEIVSRIFDLEVNSGSGQGIKNYQRQEGVEETGVLDEALLNSINSLA